jgi:hypothetical protein
MICILLLLLAGSLTPAYAEDAPVARVAEPYTKNEFAPWMQDLWRAEAIFVGSFPFALFATLEVYDTWRYATNSFDVQYAPWPIGSSDVVKYSETETLWLAVSALSLSLVVTGIDFIIERIRESKKR